MARVSIRDVALRAGVSVGTVSNVLNRPDEVSDDSLARVNAAVESLGYVRNDAARKLRNGVSSTVGFVVLDGQNPFFNDVVRGAEDEASRHQIAVLYGNTDEDPSRERQYLDLFEEQQVRGVLIAPYGDISQRLEKLRGRGVPVVLVDRFSGDGRYSSVSVDSVAGGRMAAEHLIETGRRRLAFVGGPFEIRQVTDRLAGARVAVENSDASVDLEVVATTALTVAQGVAAGMRILARPRRDRPDALFAANDLVALGLLQALAVDGRMLVPDEIALIGFDDISFAAAAAVPLSSMRQPSSVIGRTALRVLLEEAADPELIPRQTVFLPELVARASTRARR
ncbi:MULTISPECIES: LacI family DNA-binding transcriptional regulator [unclassified Rathayibacter]|uniref:LacI family DNA-binding transcriptional regulator n=1 Tax=unclassified Rathayibacter TaxID=2609250 RepID=UPI001FB2A796|nr:MULTISPECIES: LacI family DNA-binding transcriptional regulator [unclassified Rathayibacter]MCJ1671789.1 LacI family transcriptional regulator [Rathayibacter sp. VKM Ac-2929]MCJ1684038.1 LacI family transcriptional regulator [Rathayibacter sp. VKM Ac-2928]MCJ1686820.1 LacI family transcriptional regulator [Rathayibacter sp. VKM Ac-2927]